MQHTLQNTTAISDSVPATTAVNDAMEKPGFSACCARRTSMTVAAVVVISGDLMAQGLPTTAPPTRGSTSGNYIKTIQDYAFDIFTVVGFLLAVVAFVAVVKNTIGAYVEVQDGKGTWGQVGMQAIVGALLVVFVVFLLTDASSVL